MAINNLFAGKSWCVRDVTWLDNELAAHPARDVTTEGALMSDMSDTPYPHISRVPGQLSVSLVVDIRPKDPV